MVLNGVGTLVEVVTWALCDEGDGILLPSPYYAGYESDITVRQRARIVSCPLSPDDNFTLTPSHLDDALARAQADGVRVRALILCSPHNPLGRVFPERELQSILAWLRAHPDVHLISDGAVTFE